MIICVPYLFSHLFFHTKHKIIFLEELEQRFEGKRSSRAPFHLINSVKLIILFEETEILLEIMLCIQLYKELELL